MIRLIIYIALIAAAGYGAIWMVDRPGELVLNWQGYRVSTSIMVAMIVAVIFILTVLVIWGVIRAILASPTMLSRSMRAKRRERAYGALTDGLIAVGNGDSSAAKRHTGAARKLLGDDPLSLLLQAQSAQISGDEPGARRAYEAMIDNPQTKGLGLRGLFAYANRHGDTVAARAYVDEMLANDGRSKWAAQARFEVECAEGDFAAALKTLKANYANRLIDRAEERRLRAVLLTGQALETDDRAHALSLALQAHKLAPDLIPAAILAGRDLGEQGRLRKASKVIEKTWKLAPHPDLAAVYAGLRTGDSANDRLKRVKTLAGKLLGHRESAMAIAEASIHARDWREARAALADLAGANPTQRVCELMAHIEESEHGDQGAVRAWLARAMRAARDPVWIADGVVFNDWAAISPITGRVDAFEWTAPPDHLTSPDGVPGISGTSRGAALSDQRRIAPGGSGGNVATATVAAGTALAVGAAATSIATSPGVAPTAEAREADTAEAAVSYSAGPAEAGAVAAGAGVGVGTESAHRAGATSAAVNVDPTGPEGGTRLAHDAELSVSDSATAVREHEAGDQSDEEYEDEDLEDESSDEEYEDEDLEDEASDEEYEDEDLEDEESDEEYEDEDLEDEASDEEYEDEDLEDEDLEDGASDEEYEDEDLEDEDLEDEDLEDEDLEDGASDEEYEDEDLEDEYLERARLSAGQDATSSDDVTLSPGSEVPRRQSDESNSRADDGAPLQGEREVTTDRTARSPDTGAQKEIEVPVAQIAAEQPVTVDRQQKISMKLPDFSRLPDDPGPDYEEDDEAKYLTSNR